MGNWVVLAEDEPNKIHLLRAELELNGVRTLVADEEVAASMPFLQPTIRLMVDADDVDRAREMLEDFELKWESAEEESEEEEKD